MVKGARISWLWWVWRCVSSAAILGIILKQSWQNCAGCCKPIYVNFTNKQNKKHGNISKPNIVKFNNKYLQLINEMSWNIFQGHINHVPFAMSFKFQYPFTLNKMAWWPNCRVLCSNPIELWPPYLPIPGYLYISLVADRRSICKWIKGTKWEKKVLSSKQTVSLYHLQLNLSPYNTNSDSHFIKDASECV